MCILNPHGDLSAVDVDVDVDVGLDANVLVERASDLYADVHVNVDVHVHVDWAVTPRISNLGEARTQLSILFLILKPCVHSEKTDEVNQTPIGPTSPTVVAKPRISKLGKVPPCIFVFIYVTCLFGKHWRRAYRCQTDNETKMWMDLAQTMPIADHNSLFFHTKKNSKNDNVF